MNGWEPQVQGGDLGPVLPSGPGPCGGEAGVTQMQTLSQVHSLLQHWPWGFMRQRFHRGVRDENGEPVEPSRRALEPCFLQTAPRELGFGRDPGSSTLADSPRLPLSLWTLEPGGRGAGEGGGPSSLGGSGNHCARTTSFATGNFKRTDGHGDKGSCVFSVEMPRGEKPGRCQAPLNPWPWLWARRGDRSRGARSGPPLT